MDEYLLLGQYERSLDDKGRVLLSSKYRDYFRAGSETVIMRPGEDGCIVVYPLDEWKRQSERLSRLSERRKDDREYMRMFFSEAVQARCDKQGRVSLTPELRAKAGIGRDVVIVGLNTHFEIWANENISRRQALSDEQLEGIAERIDGIE